VALEDWLVWADRAYFGAAIAAAVLTAITVVAGIAQNRLNARISENRDRAFAEFRIVSETRARELEKETVAAKSEGEKANERAKSLEAQAADTRERAAIIEERLLSERRLTARERWRLERVERAVLPRSLYVDWPGLVTELKAGNFQPINLAYIEKPEPREFAFNLMIAMQQAGVLGKFISLPATSTNSPTVPTSSSGGMIVIANPDGDRLAQMLFQKFQIGGGGMSVAVLPDEWIMIPKDANCLVIEDNNWAMAPANGQPGEGLDAHGGPDPAPH
jgi:hypothetical protein